MRQTAKIREDVGMSRRIWRTGTPFTINHHLLPWVEGSRLNCNLVLASWSLPEPDTSQAIIIPCKHVGLHSGPPHYIFHELVSLVTGPVVAEDPDVHL